jgi:hypothetical protein
MASSTRKAGGKSYELKVTGEGPIRLSVVCGRDEQSVALVAPFTARLEIETLDGKNLREAKELRVKLVADNGSHSTTMQFGRLTNPSFAPEGQSSWVNDMSGNPVNQVREITLMAGDPTPLKPGQTKRSWSPDSFPNRLILKLEPLGSSTKP